MRIVVTILLVAILECSTSDQQYPNCGDCQRDGEYDMFSTIMT